MPTRRSSLLDDLFHLVSSMPPWGGVALAVGCYGACHLVAGPMPVPSFKASFPETGELVPYLAINLGRVLATVLQYVLPVVCIAGAIASVLRRRKRARLLNDASAHDGRAAVSEMSWQSFEQLVGEFYRRQGYVVDEASGGGADDGIDLVLRRNGERTLVQCKHWKAFNVGVSVVRETYGAMAAENADAIVVVTSGRFTSKARAFAKGRRVDLIDGERLLTLFKAVHTSRARQIVRTTPRDATPKCPVCSCSMVLRTAKKGARAGAPFWGCLAFPSCKGTRDASPTATAAVEAEAA